jgi:putative FmdB family regulatory protein
MPIYEYRCHECGREFEVIQKFSDDPLTQCKHCGGAVTKLISQTSFRLKGSGWYVTDYAKGRSGPGSNGSARSEGETKSSESSGSSSDAKTSGSGSDSSSTTSKS